MKSAVFTTLTLATLLASAAALGADAQDRLTIGQVTALIPEASTADADPEHSVDGASGDTDFPFVSAMKPLLTVGEVDKDTGMALTGYPDGHAAWLVDDNTLRIAYQSESYATMSSETYRQTMTSGASFTGSHVHTIDYDRVGLADYLTQGKPAAEIVEGSGHLYNRIFNVFGDEVKPKERFKNK